MVLTLRHCGDTTALEMGGNGGSVSILSRSKPLHVAQTQGCFVDHMQSLGVDDDHGHATASSLL